MKIFLKQSGEWNLLEGQAALEELAIQEISIGERASIGEGASIGNGASIGKWASIGNGASIGEGRASARVTIVLLWVRSDHGLLC